MKNEVTLAIEDAAGTVTEHTVTPRPWDQFGFVKWAEPVLGITSITEDAFAFGLYGAIRSLRRTGVLDTEEQLADQMQRVVSLDYGDDEAGDGAEADPTTPAP